MSAALPRRAFPVLAALLLLLVGAVAVTTGSRGVRNADDGPAQRATSAERLATRAFSSQPQPPAPQSALTSTSGRLWTDPLELTGGAVDARVTPIGARPAPATTRGASRVYVDAWPGVDVVHEAQPGMLKEALVLRGASAPHRFGFAISGATPVLAEDGSLRYRRGAATLGLRTPPPFAVDADGDLLPTGAVRYRVDRNVMTLAVDPPRGTAYPVTVDPTFTMGQAADAVIGATSFTDRLAYAGKETYGLQNPQQLASSGSVLLATNSISNSVVGYTDGLPSSNAEPLDLYFRGPAGSQFGTSPKGIWTDGTRMLVADSGRHRVLVYDAIPASTVTARTTATPAFVLGQPTLGTSVPNAGGISSRSMRDPNRVWSDGNRIVISDTGNNRVLIWTSWPTQDNQQANIILGQGAPAAVRCNRGGSTAAETLCNPRGVYFDGVHFFVADTSNNRVLGWNGFPSSTGQPADFVIGQSALTRAAANDAALPSTARLLSPNGVSGDGTRLLVADSSNHRVLIWNGLPATVSTDGLAADVQLGSAGASGVSRSTFWTPMDAVAAGSGLAVSDYENNRILLWDQMPTADTVLPDRVAGHPDFDHGGLSDDRGDAPHNTAGVAFDAQQRLHVLAPPWGVVRRYPATLPAAGATAEYEIGSTAPGEHSVGGAAHLVNGGRDLRITADNMLFAAQEGQSRVTWRTALPTTAPSPILLDGEVGQAALTGDPGRNRGQGPAANTLSGSLGVDFDGSVLAVADTGNNRVLLWRKTGAGGAARLPSLGEAADVVLGQPDMTSTTANNGGLSANSLNRPTAVRLHEGRLYVADQSNNRVLIWESLPTSSHQRADLVLGQADFTSSVGASTSATLPTGMNGPFGISIDDHTLVVTDQFNDRVLIWDSLPTTSSTPPNRVIGQAALNQNLSTTATQVTSTGMLNPRYVDLRDGRLAVTESNRVKVYDDIQAPVVSAVSSPPVTASGRTSIGWVTDEDATSELFWGTTPQGAGPTCTGYDDSTTSTVLTRQHLLVSAGLTANTTYYYCVQSYDARGNVGRSAEYSFTTRNTTRLEASATFSADTDISSASPTLNHGAATLLRTGATAGGDVRRSMVRFDLSQVPSSATNVEVTLGLSLAASVGGPQPVAVHGVATAFTPGRGTATVETDGASWNLADGVDPWLAPGGDVDGPSVATVAVPDTPQAVTIASADLDALVAGWVDGSRANRGLHLRTVGEPTGQTKDFWSSDVATPALRPVLTVTWQGADTLNPAIAGLRATVQSPTTATVQWTTDEQSTHVVEYGPTAQYGRSVTTATAVNAHTASLNGLEPGTLYHYRVRATDAAGNEAVSADRVFLTGSTTRLPAVADAHVRSDLTTRNSGGQPSLVVGSPTGTWGPTRSLLRFDLSGLPSGTTINSAALRMRLDTQSSTGQPNMTVHRVTRPWTEGTGNPLVAPATAGVVSGSVATSVPPLMPAAETHLFRTAGSWTQLVPVPDVSYSTVASARRSTNGATFGTVNTTFGTGWGRTGLAAALDGDDVWVAGFTDGTSLLRVGRFAAGSMAQQATGTVTTLPVALVHAPGLAMASTGHLWAKGETVTGEVWVARSTLPRDASAWQAPQLLLAKPATAGHAQLVALAGGRMLAILQDGATLTSREWDGSSWGAANVVALDGVAPATWLTDMTFAAAVDGSGGAWLGYRTAAGALRALRFTGGAWTGAETVATGVTSLAMSTDLVTGNPYAFWSSANASCAPATAACIRYSTRTGGGWAAPVQFSTVGAGITPVQVSASPPSNESLAVSWTEPAGAGVTTQNVRWRALTLRPPPDGATWATSDGSTPWTTPGGDAGPALDTQAAPNASGAALVFDLTAQAQSWVTGANPNDGVLVRKASEVSSDWKAWHSSEAIAASLRPALEVQYEVPTLLFDEPNGLTAWRPASARQVTWQTVGTAMVTVDLEYSGDDGVTWAAVGSGLPNSGSHAWTTPGAPTSTARMRITGRDSGGSVLATATSDRFAIDGTPPSAVVDLDVPSPSIAPQLTWSAPADTGGAGMARGWYYVYRATTAGGPTARIATVSTTSFTDSTALPDGTYHYSVHPVDAAGNVQTTGNIERENLRDNAAPDPVDPLTATPLSRTAIALSWDAPADNGAAGMGTYRVHRSPLAGALGPVVATTAATSATDAPPYDGTWYYAIVPVDAAGNARLSGNAAATAVYDTTPPQGTALTLHGGQAWSTARAVAAGLTWSPGDATDYQLSQDPTFAGSSWAPVAAAPTHTLDDADGSHVVYARFRDAAGNVSGAVTDSINLDRSIPTTPGPVRDGATLDRDYTADTTTLSAWWTASADSGSGLARHEFCMGTTIDATGCTGTPVQGWTSAALGTTAIIGALSLTPGTAYTSCARAVDVAGNVSPPACSDGIVPVSLDAVSPGTGARGRSGITLVVTGAGFAPDAQVGIAGAGVAVGPTTRISPTRLEASVDVSSLAALTARDVTVTDGDGTAITLTGAFTVEASHVDISVVGCSASAVALGAVEPGDTTVSDGTCAITFGSNNNTAILQTYQADADNTAMAGVADYDAGTTDWATGTSMFGACLESATAGAATDATTWQATGSCTDDDGSPWNAVPETASVIAVTEVAGAEGATVRLRVGMRAAADQPPGTYTAPMVIETVAPELP